ncbi:hypothetical protein MHYP_G00211500 [Metynnis hypsauchen]
MAGPALACSAPNDPTRAWHARGQWQLWLCGGSLHPVLGRMRGTGGIGTAKQTRLGRGAARTAWPRHIVTLLWTLGSRMVDESTQKLPAPALSTCIFDAARAWKIQRGVGCRAGAAAPLTPL